MGIDADRVSRQTEQLRSTDVLVVPESPSRQWGMLLGCVVFTVLSVGLLTLANQSDSSLQFMVGGIAGVVFFGVVGISAVMRKILRRSRLVVTPGGLRLERRSGQSLSTSPRVGRTSPSSSGSRSVPEAAPGRSAPTGVPVLRR